MNAIFANLRKSEMALNLEFKVEILNANQQINQVFFYILEKSMIADFVWMKKFLICKNLTSIYSSSKTPLLERPVLPFLQECFPH
jgi:hypothetical protein